MAKRKEVFSGRWRVMDHIDSEELDMVGKRIAEFRDKANFTNETLASALGVSVPTVKSWVGGNGLNNFLKLKYIAETLGVTPNDLLYAQAPDVRSQNQNYQNLLATVEGALRHVGVKPPAMSQLVALIEELATDPITPGEADPLEIRKHLAESAVRRFLKQGGGQS